MSEQGIGAFRIFVSNIRKKALFLGAFLGSIMLIFGMKSIGFGYLCGTLLSLVNFQLMAADAFGMVDKSSKAAKKFILFRYFLRYAILFSALVLLVTRTDFNIIAVFVGVFTVQIVVIGDKLLEASGFSGWGMKG
jgi:hypothetical protein